jgi:rhodanese-related sulfurtransferase
MAVPRITKEELKQKLESGDSALQPLLLDVRLKYPYEHSSLKLPGALRISPVQPDVGPLPKDRELIAYDSDPGEIVSARVAAQLIRLGYRASVLKGGIADWIAANYPTETKEAPRPSAPGSLKG